MFTGLQFAVIDEAETILASSDGYEGLCLDNLPNDQDIAVIGFSEAVSWLVTDTVEADGLIVLDKVEDVL